MNQAILVLYGPTGAGKTTIKNYLLQSGLNPIVSYTTREPRDGEVDGVDYHFINFEEWLHLNDVARIINKVCYNKHFYGIKWNDVLELNKVSVLVTDVSSLELLRYEVEKVNKTFLSCLCTTYTSTELVQRLVKRNTPDRITKCIEEYERHEENRRNDSPDFVIRSFEDLAAMEKEIKKGI